MSRNGVGDRVCVSRSKIRIRPASSTMNRRWSPAWVTKTGEGTEVTGCSVTAAAAGDAIRAKARTNVRQEGLIGRRFKRDARGHAEDDLATV
jgi:hypothetical protein